MPTRRAFTGTTKGSYAGTDQNQLLTEKITGGNTYVYVYGGNDGAGVPEIVEQNTSGAGTSSVLTDPGTRQALNLTTADGVTGLYLVDAIGNQVGLLTETRTTAFRVAYSPYRAQAVTAGAASDAWEQNPYGFKNGNRTDNGVLVKFGMRWYLAITGTWTQRDTLDAPLDPKNANRYGYAGGDPINASDPTGKFVNSLRRGFQLVTASIDGTKAITGGSVIALVAGGVAETACYAGATAAGVGTGGVGLVATRLGTQLVMQLTTDLLRPKSDICKPTQATDQRRRVMDAKQPTGYERTAAMFIGGAVFLAVGLVMFFTVSDLSAQSAKGGQPLWLIALLLVVAGAGLLIGGLVRSLRKK